MQVVQESSCPEGGSEGCCRVCQICYEGTVSAPGIMMWNDQQSVKCKYKTDISCTYAIATCFMMNYDCSEVMNCFIYFFMDDGM